LADENSLLEAKERKKDRTRWRCHHCSILYPLSIA